MERLPSPPSGEGGRKAPQARARPVVGEERALSALSDEEFLDYVDALLGARSLQEGEGVPEGDA